MNKSRFLPVLIIVCLLITLFPTAVVAQTAYSSITGTVSLPGTDTAPAGGLKVSLLVGTNNLTPNNNKDDVEVTYDITIPQGQSSHSFSMMVPKSSNADAKYTVFYTVGNGYAPYGWYSETGTVAIKDKRTQVNLNAENISNINVQLLAGKIISGKIILGNNKTSLPKDMKYTITAIQKGANNSSNEDDIILAKEVTIPAGQAEAAYQLIVPVNTSGSGYMVCYNHQNDKYKETGYYHTSGTTRTESNVTLIDVSNTVSGINLTTMPFTVISGRLYLPDANKAPQNGIEAIITALNKGASTANTDDFSFMQNVIIAKDTNYVDYRIAVPVVALDYTVSYTVSKNSGYISEGFYNTEDTVTQASRATLLDISDNPVGNVNLRILKKATPAPTVTPSPYPTPIPGSDAKYDVNDDGYVNVFDLLDLAKVIVRKYEKEGFDKDLKQYEKREMTTEDMKVFWDVFKPFTNNKYKTKWFNNVKNWFNFNSDDWKNFDWGSFNWNNFNWQNYNWEDFDWKNFNWEDYDWEDYDWEDWFDCDDDDKKDRKEKNNNGKKIGWNIIGKAKKKK